MYHTGPITMDKTSTESSQSIEIVVDRNQQQLSQQVVNYTGTKSFIITLAFSLAQILIGHSLGDSKFFNQQF